MSKTFNLNIFVIIFILLLLTGCKKTKFKYTKVLKNNVVKENNTIFKLVIEGVECRACAKNVIKILENIAGICKAEIICPKPDFQGCYAQVFTHSKNPDFEKIKKELKVEGFVLKNIRGNFCGSFIKNKNLYFKFDGEGNITAKVQYKPDTILKLNDLICVEGLLVINENEFVIYI